MKEAADSEPIHEDLDDIARRIAERSGAVRVVGLRGGAATVVGTIPGRGKLGSQYFAWQNLVQVTIGPPGLKPGEQLRITFGDRSRGSRGWRVQPFDETHYGFKCYVDLVGGGAVLRQGLDRIHEDVDEDLLEAVVFSQDQGQTGIEFENQVDIVDLELMPQHLEDIIQGIVEIDKVADPG